MKKNSCYMGGDGAIDPNEKILYLESGKDTSVHRHAFLEIMQTRAMKDIKNQINRRSNFESANLSRSIEAGLKQVAVIEEILEKIKLSDMTKDLEELCTLRLENPDSSLDEIGKMMNPELSRSAVSRRFKKLEKIAAELKTK